VLVRYLMPMMQVNPTGLVGSPAQVIARGPAVRFLLSTDTDANGNPVQVILTNQPQATAVYTFRNQNTTMYDALFVQGFSAYLGARICIPLTGDKVAMRNCYQMAQQFTRDAQVTNGNEGLTIIDSMPDWLRVRGYAADWAQPDGGCFMYGPQALSMVT
jgi:hypothetical protein